MTLNLRDDQGRDVALGPKLGEGGEGAVYKLVANDRMAVKIYNKDMHPDRVQKIQILSHMDGDALDRYVARPLGLVRDDKNKPRGLIMPVVGGADDIHYLYNTGSRRKKFPTATWAFLVHVATNVARAFASVHQLGLVIGDVNPGSVLVLPDGTVRLIDVDSFQVPVSGARPLLCTVAVPMFLPPELHGAQLDSTVRTANHDAFGLAVMLFHLLALGRHPYAGVFRGHGEMSLEKAVSESRFAYGRRAGELGMSKPPGSIDLEALSPEIAALFESAFARPRNAMSRPSAVQWLNALAKLQKNLKQCSKSVTHHYYQGLSVCPWCEFERVTGKPLFDQGGPSVHAGSVKTAPVEAQYRQLSDFFSNLPPGARQKSPTITKRPVGGHVVLPETGRRLHEWVGIFVGILCCLGGLEIGGGAGLYFTLVGLGCIAWGIVAPTRRRPAWVDDYKNAVHKYEKTLSEIEKFNCHSPAIKVRQQAAELQESWHSIPLWKDQEMLKLESKKRKEQRRKFLESQLIGDASIKGVGASRVAMLASFNINTAWDVDRQAIMNVPNFGPVLADRLVAWRSMQEQKFVFRPAEPLPPSVLASLDQELEKKQSRVVADLSALTHMYKSAVAKESLERKRLSIELNAAERQLQQVAALATAAAKKKSPK